MDTIVSYIDCGRIARLGGGSRLITTSKRRFYTCEPAWVSSLFSARLKDAQWASGKGSRIAAVLAV